MATNDQRLFLRAIFGIYVFSILVFAVVYLYVFKSYPKSFVFNADIRSARSESFQESAKEQIAKLLAQIPLLTDLEHTLATKSKFDSTTDILTFPRIEFMSSPIYSYQFSDDRRKRHDKPRFETIVAYDLAGRSVFERTVPIVPLLTDEAKIAYYHDFASSFLSEIRQTVQKRESQLASLGGPTPDVWSFLDFLYFSTITQTTVGYGDILPDSTLVRMLVVLQLVISSGLLIVVLNSVLQLSKSR